MTPVEIIHDPRQLWLNSPEGYPFAQKIEKGDIGQLKSFLISTTPDEATQELVRQMSHEQLIESYINNNFTFDEQFLGARLFDWQKV